MRILLLLPLVVVTTGCFTIAEQQGRLPHVEFKELAAVPKDAPPEQRVDAATKASTVIYKETIEVDAAGEPFIWSPVGSPIGVAGQPVWWLDDTAPLIDEKSKAKEHLDRHVEHRGRAMQHDLVFETGGIIAVVAAAGGAAGLGWLLFLNGGDPAFYVTLGLTAGGSAAAMGTFAGWYFLALPDHVEARKAKIDFMSTYHQGVAERYGVKIEPAEKSANGDPQVRISAQ